MKPDRKTRVLAVENVERNLHQTQTRQYNMRVKLTTTSQNGPIKSNDYDSSHFFSKSDITNEQLQLLVLMNT